MPLALVARRAVHGVVEGPQLSWLRQVQQIVQKNGMIKRHKALSQSPLPGGSSGIDIVHGVEIEKAADKCADRVSPDTGAEVEHESSVAGESSVAPYALELLDHARLADARLAPDVN